MKKKKKNLILAALLAIGLGARAQNRFTYPPSDPSVPIIVRDTILRNLPVDKNGKALYTWPNPYFYPHGLRGDSLRLHVNGKYGWIIRLNEVRMPVI